MEFRIFHPAFVPSGVPRFARRALDQKPGHTGCSGSVFMCRHRDPDWQVQIMNTQPLPVGVSPASGKKN